MNSSGTAVSGIPGKEKKAVLKNSAVTGFTYCLVHHSSRGQPEKTSIIK